MRRFSLTSRASSLVIALVWGNAAFGQTVYSVPAGQSQSVSGPITDGSFSTSVQVTGGGGVTFTGGANSYSGATTVDGGSTLTYSSDGQLGASTAATPNVINLGDTTNNGTLAVSNGASSFTSLRNININAGNGVLIGPGNGNAVTYSGAVSGVGALTINGGTVGLTNATNSFTGPTQVSGGGILQVPIDAALGTSLTSTVILGDANTSGTLQWTNSAAISTSRSFILNNGGNSGGTVLTNSAGPVTMLGTISGIGSLTVGGTGTLVLGATNLYTGTTTVLSGATLQISSDNNLGGYTSVTNQITGLANNTFSTNNTLNLNGGTLQFGAAATVQHSVAINSQGGTIDTNGAVATITASVSGDKSGTDSLTKIGAGTLILDGVNSYTGGTTVTTGTLTIGDGSSNATGASVLGGVVINSGATVGGSGSIGGTLTNNGGTVAPANVLTAGSYVQNSGSLAPVIGPNTSAGSLSEVKVNGTATINGGTLGITYAPGFLHAGQYAILNANAINGAFSAVSAGNPSLGLTAAIIQQGDSYYLVLTQLASLPNYDRPNILPVLNNAVIDDAQQTTGTLLDRLAGVRTNALADEMAVALTETHRVRASSPYGMWVQPLGDFGTTTGNSGVEGYHVKGGGLMAGVDTEWFPGISIGAALGYTNSYIYQADNSSGTVSVPRFSVYGGWWRGAFALDGVVAIGLGQVDGNRPVAGEVAHSKHNANEKIAALQASAAFAFDGWVIGPAVGVKYLNLRQTSFTETGTDLYNFTAGSASINSLRPFANAGFTKRFMISDHWSLVPDLKVGVEHEVNNEQQHVLVQTSGDAQSFLYYGFLPGSDIVRLDGGLKLETSRDAAFYVDYNHLQSSTSNSEYITGGFRYRL